MREGTAQGARWLRLRIPCTDKWVSFGRISGSLMPRRMPCILPVILAKRQWVMDIQLRRKLWLIPRLVQSLIVCHLTRIIYIPMVKQWKWALSPKLPNTHNHS